MTLNITSDLIDALQAEAATAHPNECCGIMLSDTDDIRLVIPANNVHPSPEAHFEIDPATLITAHKKARDGGWNILGYYHSHPTGHPEPSPTDQAMSARDGKIWAIIGQVQAGAGEVKFWRDEPGGFKPLSYQIQDG